MLPFQPNDTRKLTIATVVARVNNVDVPVPIDVAARYRFAVRRPERIRQIVADSYDSLRKPAKLALLNPLWNAMWACLEAQAKPIAPEKLAQALGRRLNWSQAPDASAVERLCRLHPNLLITTQHVSINADWPT